LQEIWDWLVKPSHAGIGGFGRIADGREVGDGSDGGDRGDIGDRRERCEREVREVTEERVETEELEGMESPRSQRVLELELLWTALWSQSQGKEAILGSKSKGSKG
jgi:hypothetical protein